MFLEVAAFLLAPGGTEAWAMSAVVSSTGDICVERRLVGKTGIRLFASVSLADSAGFRPKDVCFSPGTDYAVITASSDKEETTRTWLISGRTLAAIGLKTLKGNVPWPKWRTSNTLFFFDDGATSRALEITLAKSGTRERSVERPPSKRAMCQHAEDIARLVKSLHLYWPMAQHMPPDIGPMAFDNHKGRAVVSPTGDLAIVCTRDESVETGAKNVILKRENGSWRKTPIGEVRFPTFVLAEPYVVLHSRKTNSGECTVFDASNGRPIGTFSGEVADIVKRSQE